MSDKSRTVDTGFSSNAQDNPRRVVFITSNTSARVQGDVGRQVMSFPHLLLRETIAFQVLTIVLVVVALLWDAPLEQLANPLSTPNPAKAPWYFLGFQELLHYFPPLVAGVLIQALVVIALIAIPYFNVNVQGEPLWGTNRKHRLTVFLVALAPLVGFLGLYKAWTVLIPTIGVAGLALASYLTPIRARHWNGYWQSRPLSWWVMTWFIVVALTLTIVGTFFRGPGWSWVWPGSWRAR
jgi:hypothetical protein